MKHRGKPKTTQKICLFDEDEIFLLKRATGKFETYESEIIREALKDFYTKHEITKE